MKKGYRLGIVAIGLLMLSGSWTMNVGAADKPGRALRHIVLYKFKPELSTAQVQEVVDAFGSLAKKVDTIIDFEWGTNVSQEQKSQGFTHCFVVTFADEQGRETYLKSPAHDEYVKVVRDRREQVIVFDYWTGP
jgi:hypothetical protein